MSKVIRVKEECFSDIKAFEEEIRKAEDISGNLEIEIYKRILDEQSDKPELVLSEQDENNNYGTSMYNFRNYGYQIGGFNGNGDQGSLYSNLEQSYPSVGKELACRLIDMQVKAMATFKNVLLVEETDGIKVEELRKMHVTLGNKSKELFDKFIELEKKQNTSLVWINEANPGTVERRLEKYKSGEHSFMHKRTEEVFNKFCNDHNLKATCIYGEVQGTYRTKDGLRAFAVTEDDKFLYIDDRFSRTLVIELPKDLVLSNLEGLLQTLEAYVCFCVGGFNSTTGTYTLEEKIARRKAKEAARENKKA